jgi:hypothetical protein
MADGGPSNPAVQGCVSVIADETERLMAWTAMTAEERPARRTRPYLRRSSRLRYIGRTVKTAGVKDA